MKKELPAPVEMREDQLFLEDNSICAAQCCVLPFVDFPKNFKDLISASNE